MNSPDYSNYSISELYEAIKNIDKDAYPDRYKILINEIQKRENIQESFPKGKAKPTDTIKIVAIVSIVFGALCVLSNIAGFFTADLIDMSKEVIVKASKSNSAFSDLANMFQIPDWYKTWLKVNSILSIIIAAGIIFSAVKFMERKRNFDKYLIGALILNVIIYLVNAFLNPITLPNLGASVIIFGGLWSNAIELILIGFISFTDTKEFRVAT